jgi:hypothetical protein
VDFTNKLLLRSGFLAFFGGESGGVSRNCDDPVGDDVGDPMCVRGDVLLLLSLLIVR